jgi:hypothetical protein
MEKKNGRGLSPVSITSCRGRREAACNEVNHHIEDLHIRFRFDILLGFFIVCPVCRDRVLSLRCPSSLFLFSSL